MKSAAKFLNAPSKYSYSFLLFPSASSSLLQAPHLPHQREKLRWRHQGRLCCACAQDTGLPLLARPGFSFHVLMRYPPDSAPRSIYLPALYFSFLRSGVQCLILLCPPQHHHLFCFISGEAWAEEKVCAACIASLLLAQIGTADVIREDALEAGRERALCCFCMLNMLHATAQVKSTIHLRLSGS